LIVDGLRHVRPRSEFRAVECGITVLTVLQGYCPFVNVAEKMNTSRNYLLILWSSVESKRGDIN